jgi:hypothetical protein
MINPKSSHKAKTSALGGAELSFDTSPVPKHGLKTREKGETR